MREIGVKLGLQVEFKDMVFESLEPSLTLGQVDAAIAAITVTPEREAAYSFTNAYYISQDGVLARADSPVRQPHQR